MNGMENSGLSGSEIYNPFSNSICEDENGLKKNDNEEFVAYQETFIKQVEKGGSGCDRGLLIADMRKLTELISAFSEIPIPIRLNIERFSDQQGKTYENAVICNANEVVRQFFENHKQDFFARIATEKEKSACQQWSNSAPISVVNYLQNLVKLQQQDALAAEEAAIKVKIAEKASRKLKERTNAVTESMKVLNITQGELLNETKVLHSQFEKLLKATIKIERDLFTLKEDGLGIFNEEWANIVDDINFETNAFNLSHDKVKSVLEKAKFANNIPEQNTYQKTLQSLWDEICLTRGILSAKQQRINIYKDTVPKLEKLFEEITAARNTILIQKREFEDTITNEKGWSSKTLPPEHKALQSMAACEAAGLEKFKKFEKRIATCSNIYGKLKIQDVCLERYSFQPLKDLFNPPFLREEHTRYFSKEECFKELKLEILLDTKERTSLWKKITDHFKKICEMQFDFSLQINQIGDCSRDGYFTKKTYYDENAKITQVMALGNSVIGSVASVLPSMIYNANPVECKGYAIPAVKFDIYDPHLEFKENV